ncbi:hypothetical protein [Maribellus sediminis]|uniref:hypothetical protein n=1 Tax=Maribellus sediminis TaxID=2696285 RepID=UPI001430CDBB|nr:hypothetical protein [Maribellus sediminis]
MKTKNNVQKATTKLFALGLILVVLGLNVNAQKLGKSLPETVGFKQLALAMVDNPIEPKSSSTRTEVDASNFVVETEEALELEDWMTDEVRFDVYSQYSLTEQEEALELEDWMIDESTFKIWSFQLTVETESRLELEDWMTSDELWNR